MATGEYWLQPVEPRNKPKPACDLVKAQQYYNDAYKVITKFKVKFSKLFDYASVEMKEPLVLNTADCVKAQLYIAQLLEPEQHHVVAKLEEDIAALLTAAETLLGDADAWAKAKTIHDEMNPKKQWFIFSQKLKNTTSKATSALTKELKTFTEALAQEDLIINPSLDCVLCTKLNCKDNRDDEDSQDDDNNEDDDDAAVDTKDDKVYLQLCGHALCRKHRKEQQLSAANAAAAVGSSANTTNAGGSAPAATGCPEKCNAMLTCTGRYRDGIPCIALSDNDGPTGDELERKMSGDHDLLNAGMKLLTQHLFDTAAAEQIAKICEDIINLDDDERVVVFSQHPRALNLLAKALRKHEVDFVSLYAACVSDTYHYQCGTTAVHSMSTITVVCTSLGRMVHLTDEDAVVCT
eukprot:16496-Heterococcus_DN1.PRE.3